ncbi:MAG: DMT family transporter [Hyphomicrobiaceae bacterium]|nr:DMT family transporter [Hyphomicrobiaceae bacterium]
MHSRSMQKANTAAPSKVHLAADPVRAILLMCLASALFACLDTTAKYLVLVPQIPMSQVVWMRYVGQLAAMVAMLGLVALPSLLSTQRLGAQLVRSCLLLGSTAFNFIALRHLRLDQTTTIGFLTPLMVAVLAGPLLGEWIGWRRAIAILVGFSGVLLAVRPGISGLHPAFLFAFGSMLCYAFFSIITRYLAAYDSSEATLFYSMFAGTFLVAPLAIADWTPPADLGTWGLLWAMGLFGAIGHYFFILAHRYAPASRVVPFIYVTLLTHSLAGFAVFGQVPDAWTLAGAGIVIGSGLYLFHRERVTARAEAMAMTTQAAPSR